MSGPYHLKPIPIEPLFRIWNQNLRHFQKYKGSTFRKGREEAKKTQKHVILIHLSKALSGSLFRWHV